MRKNILEIQNLTKYYGKIKGVEDLSLKLEKGEIFGFIGPNGAGKSTTIRAIMNIINKTSGKILIDNEVFNKDNINQKEKIGYLPSEIYLYDDLTVKEMLDYHEKFYKRNIHNRRIELVKRFELDEKKKIEDLSLGNLKKLGIVLAFMHEPKLLILDEPTSGLDPIMQNLFYELLKEENDKTIEYLNSVPVTRKNIVISKVLCGLLYIILMLVIIGIFNFVGLNFSGEFDRKLYILLSVTPLFSSIVIFSICLFLSTFTHKTKKMLGISIGIVFASYFFNILSEIGESTAFLKYVSIFTLADIRNVIVNISINPIMIILSLLITLIFIILSIIHYERKELV